MMTQFRIGGGQVLAANDEMELLAGIESAIDFCLAEGNVFAIFDWKSDYCQIFLDPGGGLHAESTYGDLVAHAGFKERPADWPWHSGTYLPPEWHARAKMVAEAMTRAFIDGGKIRFPAELEVQIARGGIRRS